MGVDVTDTAALERDAEDYATSSHADSTLAAYAKHWAAFNAWCTTQQRCGLPAAPQTLALYLADRANHGIRPATLSVTLSAIAQAHELAGHPSPTDDRDVKKTWRSIRRRLGTASNKKNALSATELRRMMDALPAGLLGLRDRALILLGFAGGSDAPNSSRCRRIT
jgi:site-specific recombinase XerD